MSFLETIINDIESLWKKEEPSIEADLKAARGRHRAGLENGAGISGADHRAGLDQLRGFEWRSGGRQTGSGHHRGGAKNAGVTAANSTINTLIELAVQKIQQGAAEVTAPAATAPITS